MQLVLQQKELNNNVARFTTHIKPVLQQIRLFTGFENAQQRFSTRFRMWRLTFVPETIVRRSIRLEGTDRTSWTIQTHSDELNWARRRT